MAKRVQYAPVLERGEVVRIMMLLLDDTLSLEAAMREEKARPSEIAMSMSEEQPLWDKLAQSIKFPIPFHESLRIRRESREAIKMKNLSPGPASTKPGPGT